MMSEKSLWKKKITLLLQHVPEMAFPNVPYLLVKKTTNYFPTGHRRQFNVYSTLVQRNFIEITWKQRLFNQCVLNGLEL